MRTIEIVIYLNEYSHVETKAFAGDEYRKASAFFAVAFEEVESRS